MTVDVANLEALQSRISVLRPPVADLLPGKMVQFMLQGADDLTVQGLLDAPFSLTWITKAVQWNTDQPIALPMNLAAEILEGAPPRLPTISAAGIVPGIQELPGAQGAASPRDSPLGAFSQVAGTYTVPAQLPVKVEVCWTVRRDGEIASDCSLGSNSDAREFSVAFLPPFAELVAGTLVPTVEYEVVANIVLTAGSQPLDFSISAPVSVPCVPVPAVAAMFRHKDFAAMDDDVEGFVAVVVPSSSPFDAGAHQLIFTALDTLYGTLADLASVAADSYAVSLLLVDELRNALRAQPYIRVRRGGVSLHTIFTWLDDGAEGRISSMILLGPPGKVFQCYNRRAYHTNKGWFEISPGRRDVEDVITFGPEIITVVRNIESTEPVSSPTNQEIVIQILDLRFDNMDSACFASAALPAQVPVVGDRPAKSCDLTPTAPELLGARPKKPSSWAKPKKGAKHDGGGKGNGGKGLAKAAQKESSEGAAEADENSFAALRADIDDLRLKRLDREAAELNRREEQQPRRKGNNHRKDK